MDNYERLKHSNDLISKQAKQIEQLEEFVKDVEVYCDRRTHLHEDYSLLKERAQKALEDKDG